MTREEIRNRKMEILLKIHEIEMSEEYALQSELGDDTLYYQIEALYDDLDELDALLKELEA